MSKNRILISFFLLLLLSGCDEEITDPQPVGIASHESVALSLSTVDPEESLHLFEYDRTAPLDIQEEKRWREDNATWIDFTFASPNGGRVSARLVIPDGVGPFPGMILMHGGPGTLEDMVGFTRAFTRYGAVSIMITSPYKRPGGWVPTPYMGNTWPLFTYRDVEIKIQLINDLQRAVDILEERPEVDPDRLGYFGVSWGGSMGGLLAGVEDRIKAYVLVVSDGGLVEHTADPGEDGLNIHFSEKWAGYMWPTEPLHFVGRAAPAALLFQNGRDDPYVPPLDGLRFFIAASEPKSIIWYDAGHGLPWEFVQDAAEWLQPYLGDSLLFLGPDYRLSAKYWEWGILISVLLTVAILVIDMTRRKEMYWGERLVWFLGIFPLGPLILVFYWLRQWLTSDQYVKGGWLENLRRVFWMAGFSSLITIIGVFIGNNLVGVLPISDFRLRFFTNYTITLLSSSLLASLTGKRDKRSIIHHLLSMNVIYLAVMFYPTFVRQEISIPTWSLYIPEMLLGICFTLPIHFWLSKSGLTTWSPVDKNHSDVVKPNLKWVYFLLCISFLAVAGSFIVVVKIYTGFPWRDVILIIMGFNT